MVCGEGAGELTLQELLSVNKTTCATGTFRVHASGARLFVGSPYYELRTRSNKLCCQLDTSGEIPTYNHLQKSKWPAREPENGTEAENSLHLKTFKLATLGQIYHCDKQRNPPKVDSIRPKIGLMDSS